MRSFLLFCVFALLCASLSEAGLTKKQKDHYKQVMDDFEKDLDDKEDFVGDKMQKDAMKQLEKEEKHIKKHNQDSNATYKEKANWMSFISEDDMGMIEGQINEEEQGRGLGLINPPEDDREGDRSTSFFNTYLSYSGSLPAAYDARTQGIISPVKNQGTCGSCVSFASAAVLETCMFRAASRTTHVDLSEQQILNCGFDNATAWACGGAYPYAYLRNFGTVVGNGEGVHEQSDSYNSGALVLQCAYNDNDIHHFGARKSNYHYAYQMTDEGMMALVYNHGAILSSVHVNDDFKDYSSGTFGACSASAGTNHAIVIVGYNTNANPPYWIVKNSWGSSWGDEGYINVEMGKCGIAKNAGVAICEATNEMSADPPPPPPNQKCDLTKRFTFSARSGTWNIGYYYGSEQRVCKCQFDSNTVCEVLPQTTNNICTDNNI